MIREKKTPKITVNNTVKGTTTTTIVYGDVVTQKIDAVMGCEHGRRVGQPCPHCMGIGAASPTVNARGFAEGVPDTPLTTETIQAFPLAEDKK